MSNFLTIHNKKIHYIDIGQGYPVVLLHGYLESLAIWGEFANQLSRKFRIIAFDIPGHRESEALAEKHSMEMLAKRICETLKWMKINQCLMIGHSMGGYVTLMVHHLFPGLLSGFSLFHSHPFSDTVDTRKNRMREIGLVKNGKKDMLAKVNIPNAFAQKNLVAMKDEVDKAKAIALQTSDKGIIANLHAMMNRPDFSDELSETSKPFLLIAGKHDKYIPFNTMIPRIKLPKNASFCLLENSGHMGFIEEKEKSVISVSRFLENIKKSK